MQRLRHSYLAMRAGLASCRHRWRAPREDTSTQTEEAQIGNWTTCQHCGSWIEFKSEAAAQTAGGHASTDTRTQTSGGPASTDKDEGSGEEQNSDITMEEQLQELENNKSKKLLANGVPRESSPRFGQIRPEEA